MILHSNSFVYLNVILVITMKNHVLNCHEKNDAIWAVSFCRFKNTSMIILKVGGTFIILKIKTNDSFATEKDSVNLYWT